MITSEDNSKSVFACVPVLISIINNVLNGSRSEWTLIRSVVTLNRIDHISDYQNRMTA